MAAELLEVGVKGSVPPIVMGLGLVEAGTHGVAGQIASLLQIWWKGHPLGTATPVQMSTALAAGVAWNE